MKSFVNLRSITILVIVSAAVMGTDGTSERGDGGRNPPRFTVTPMCLYTVLKLMVR